MNGLINGLVEVGMSQLDIQPTGVEAALLHDGGAEYFLSSAADGCWIMVDSLSVRLIRDGGGWRCRSFRCFRKITMRSRGWKWRILPRFERGIIGCLGSA